MSTSVNLRQSLFRNLGSQCSLTYCKDDSLGSFSERQRRFAWFVLCATKTTRLVRSLCDAGSQGFAMIILAKCVGLSPKLARQPHAERSRCGE